MSDAPARLTHLDDAGHARIVLVLHVVDPETDETALTERYTKFLRGNLKAMQKALSA